MIKHKTGVSNRVADALSRRHSLLAELRVQVPGFDTLTDLYAADPYFSKIIMSLPVEPRSDYFLESGSLFYKSRLCIPNGSLRLKILKELHSMGYVSQARTFQLVAQSYF